MTRKNALWPALMLALVGYAPQLRAQTAGTGASTSTGTMGALIQKVGDEAYPDPNFRQTPIGKAACDSNANITFTVSGIPTVMYLESWVGSGCEQAMRGTRAAGTESCLYVKTDPLTSGVTMLTYEVPVQQLCEKDGTRSLYILGVNQMMGSDATSYFARVDLIIDTDPPDAPSSVVGGKGETEIPVEWKAPADNPWTYQILIDTNPTGAGDAGTSSTTCGSDVLKAGEEVNLDDLPDGVHAYAIGKMVSRTSLAGSDVGADMAAIGVLAIDRAGNQSTLSNIGCVQVVPTSGFWDKYKAAGGKAEQGCACSAPGRPTHNDALAMLGLVGLAGTLSVRRKLRRRA